MPEAPASRSRQQVAQQLRWTALGAVSGVLSGLSAAAFLEALAWATRTRIGNPSLLFLLPIGGLAVGLAYRYGGGRASAGTSLIIDEIHEPRGWVPRRMAPLVFVGTVITHLFGGSAGREGTAIQLAGSLTDGFSRVSRLRPESRHVLLIAAIAGGFGAVFGVPVAGAVFALEVQAVGRLRYDALVPGLAASIVGDRVVRALGVGHDAVPRFTDVDISVLLIGKVALAGVCCGLVARAFVALTHGLKGLFARGIGWAPARPLVGGVLVIALTWTVGSREYLGLSLPLVRESLATGAGVATLAFALKLLFTSVTIGSGFQGGEVTPLFVIGATLGATLGGVLGVPLPLMAALGFVAVFAGAANTPIACTVMGIELFGSGPMVLFAVACAVSYAVSPHSGIYGPRRIHAPKGPSATAATPP